MSTTKKKTRDSQGRFVTNGEESEQDTKDLPPTSYWKKLRTLIVFTMMLVLSLPWTVIIFQPARTYSNQAVEYFGVLTSNLRDSVCNCQASAICKTLNSL